MCGRYYIASEDMDAIITSLLRQLENNMAYHAKTHGEICPGDVSPVIANSKRLEKRAFFMEWGFDVLGKKIINARSETAHTRPLFRDSMQNRRCLIPASMYYEWGQQDKAKYQFYPEEGKGFVMAGLYRLEQSGKHTFTVLTRDAGEDIARLHPRMPVILPPDAMGPWLDMHMAPQTILARARTSMRFGPAIAP